MSKSVTAIAAATIAALLAGSAFAGDRGDRRQDRQAERIAGGGAAGELTDREAGRLSRQQDRIVLLEDRGAADGDVSRGDKVKMEVAQDLASRSIYRLKHN